MHEESQKVRLVGVLTRCPAFHSDGPSARHRVVKIVFLSPAICHVNISNMPVEKRRENKTKSFNNQKTVVNKGRLVELER